MRKEQRLEMGLLYYYTTSETMKYILTQGDIFATHISYLNDSEEYINGLRELREIFERDDLGGRETLLFREGDAYENALKEIPQIYSISLSKEADLLSQWYMYARESGVRLGMQFAEKRQDFEIKRKHPKGEEKRKDISAILRDVHYFTRIGMPSCEYENEEEKIAQTIKDYAKEMGIQDDFESNSIRLWKEIAPYIKNYEFRQEKEVRLVFNASAANRKDEDNTDDDLIEYRNAKGVLIPYLDVYRKDGWPVIEIMVGPGRNQDRVYNSICHFVDYNTLKIPDIEEKDAMTRFIEGMSSYQVKQDLIKKYCAQIEKTVADGQGILTYKGQIYDILKGKTNHEQEYLDRNYYSNSGIIVRKSNAPYVFS